MKILKTFEKYNFVCTEQGNFRHRKGKGNAKFVFLSFATAN